MTDKATYTITVDNVPNPFTVEEKQTVRDQVNIYCDHYSKSIDSEIEDRERENVTQLVIAVTELLTIGETSLLDGFLDAMLLSYAQKNGMGDNDIEDALEELEKEGLVERVNVNVDSIHKPGTQAELGDGNDAA